MAQNFSTDQLNDLLKQLAQKPDLLKKMAGKSPDEVIEKLPADQAAQVKSLLQNDELKQKLMSSPQAQMLMKMLMKGKGGK